MNFTTLRGVIERGNKKIMRAWAMYDWANSVHPLVITTAIFPAFYSAKIGIKAEDGERYVDLLGMHFNSTSLINYTGSFAFLLICFIVPLLSGIADYTDNKKKFLRGFCYLGALSCAGLFFFSDENLILGLVIYVLGLIGFWGSIVFYNSYLPLIAHKEQQDKLSATGYSLGYIGSATLLITCIVLHELIAMPWEVAFILTGMWWAGFAHLTLRRLPASTGLNAKAKGKLSKGFQELKWVFNQLKKVKKLRRYLQAFFVYSMGVQTVMLVAVYFGQEEINWPEGDNGTGLLISVLIIQFIAIVGALTMSALSKRIGNLTTLMIVNLIWVVICILAMVITEPIHFYSVAVLVGFVMGGIQSLSRSTYSKLLPETRDTASFFSFYDVAEKLGIVIGLFTFGLLEELGDMRTSVISLIVFFAVGLFLLFRVPKEDEHVVLDH
jgi:MFS transporter, UMF1 family